VAVVVESIVFYSTENSEEPHCGGGSYLDTVFDGDRKARATWRGLSSLSTLRSATEDGRVLATSQSPFPSNLVG
jgi:hypothetical protein